MNAPPATLGAVEASVVRAGTARAIPFLLDGESIAVTGSERRGGHALWLGSRRVAAELATDAGDAVNVVAAPASLRRELTAPRGTLVEVTLAAPTLPLAAVQWQAPRGGRWPGALRVSLVLLPGIADARCQADGERVRSVATDPDGREVAVELRLHPAPDGWTIAEAPGGGVEVRATVSMPGPVTLLLAAGTPEEAVRAMAGAAHLSAHEIRAAAQADPASLDTLTTWTGLPGLDHAVAWATVRLRCGLARGCAGALDDAFWAGLGAAAVGDAASAALAVHALRRHGADPVPWGLGAPVPADALATLLAARVTLVSGDPELALEMRRALGPGEVEARHGAADRHGWALWTLALGALADALRFAVPEGEIQALYQAAARAPVARSGFRLPMAGDPADTRLESWALWGAPDADAAWAEWRARLEEGLAGGGAGRGTWGAPSDPPGAARGAGILLSSLAHGILGLAPDAPSGRIRIAPALPAHLTRFRARGIRLGGAGLDLRYERDGPLHTLRLEPTRGRVPVTVVLEPSLPAAAVAAARVDGRPAELVATSAGARTRVSVQLILDATRVLEVETAPTTPPEG